LDNYLGRITESRPTQGDYPMLMTMEQVLEVL
jgi:hypothetical protein